MPYASSVDNIALELWAKTEPYHPLWCHLLDTAAVCNALITCLGSVDEISDNWTLFLAALHDIGKVDAMFQNQDHEQAERLRQMGLDLPQDKERFRHEARSAEWLVDYLIEKRDWGKIAARVAASTVRGHHGNFSSGFRPGDCYNESDSDGLWAALRDNLASLVAGILRIDPFSPDRFAHASRVGVKLIGLTVLSDWIASNDELFNFSSINRAAGPDAYWEQARRDAVSAVGKLELGGFGCSETAGTVISFRNVWPDLRDLRPSQRTLEDACRNGIQRGLTIIEAPMGEGKTESAVFLSECLKVTYGISGTYIALPTMATSNQMHGRYRRFLQRRDTGAVEPRLVHGMSWMLDPPSPEEAPEIDSDDRGDRHLAWEWFTPSKRALIAPEGVGTVDQALMSALATKHGFLRLLGLSGKVLIIDEVHAYDEYMTVILERLLEWCRALRIPVILLSATLSRRQKTRLVRAYSGNTDYTSGVDEPYPLITSVPLDSDSVICSEVHGSNSYSVDLRQHHSLLNDHIAAARLAAELVKEGGCACVLVNTVKQAQKIYDELTRHLPPEDCYLFHARFPAWRRNEIEETVVSLFGKEGIKDGARPKRAVLVATQVVEQSLDLDFDVMVSELAPIDLLLQRSGRLWRHADTPRPSGCERTLHILMPDPTDPDFGGSSFYGDAVLIKTMVALNGLDCFDLPHDFRPLIEACYGEDLPECEGNLKERLQEALEEWGDKLSHDADTAHTYLVEPPKEKVFSMAEKTEVYDEDEGNANSFFQAKTRLGDRTCSVLMLDDPELLDAVRRIASPGRELMRQLFLHKVDLPVWWLEDAQAETACEPYFEGARWLRHTIVVPMQNGIWHGRRRGKLLSIVNDSVKGVELRD